MCLFAQVRTDAQVPGTVLLRDPQGFVNFLTLNIQQVRRCGTLRA
jgi:hypothetical protein